VSAKLAQVLGCAGGLAPPEDHRGRHQLAREPRREPAGPGAQDVAVAGPFYVDEEPGSAPLATIRALSKRHDASEIRFLPGNQVAWMPAF
jgi:hypothetical protein